MAYTYDVFISYRHRGAVYDWVKNHFHPVLTMWLNASCSRDVDVFIDDRMDVGTDWPVELGNALAGSRLMVGVFSAEYFRATWCMSEFETILQRQDDCGIPREDDARLLVFPVKFNDGDLFTPEAQAIQYADFSEWSFPYPVFRESQSFLSFDRAIKELAEAICTRLDDVPDWDASWPRISVDRATLEPISVRLPRL